MQAFTVPHEKLVMLINDLIPQDGYITVSLPGVDGVVNISRQHLSDFKVDMADEIVTRLARPVDAEQLVRQEYGNG